MMDEEIERKVSGKMEKAHSESWALPLEISIISQGDIGWYLFLRI